ADVRRECEAQLSALTAVGIRPTHIDSHRHAHAMPGILPAVAAVAHDAQVPVVRRPLDSPTLLDPLASTKMLVLHAAWRTALRGAPDVRDRLLAMIDQLPLGLTELMMHPGYDDAVLAEQDPYRTEREAEMKALLEPAVSRRLEKGDVRVVSFREAV